jgi:hypothetical protein
MSQISGNFLATDERSGMIPERAGKKPARSVIATMFLRFLLQPAAFFFGFPKRER